MPTTRVCSFGLRQRCTPLERTCTEQVLGAMDERTAPRLYREYEILAVSLRVRPEEWPESRRAFWDY